MKCARFIKATAEGKVGGEPGSCEHVRCRSPRREGGERNLGRRVLAPCAAEGSLAKLLGVLGQSRPSEGPASPWNSPASVSLLAPSWPRAAQGRCGRSMAE